MRTRWPLLFLFLGNTAKADVIPPPEPIQCRRGQEATTSHGGTYCVYLSCTNDADCPSGMYCVGRDETHCDPRGEPCSTSHVWRCNENRGAGDPSPVVRREPGPEPERKFAQPPPGDENSGPVIATGTPEPSPEPDGAVLATHRRSGCACAAPGAGGSAGALLLVSAAALVGATTRRRLRRCRGA